MEGIKVVPGAGGNGDGGAEGGDGSAAADLSAGNVGRIAYAVHRHGEKQALLSCRVA